MKPFAILLVAFVLLSSTLLGCRRSASSSVSEGAPAAPWFADVSEQAGLSFVHDAGRLGNFFMPQIMGSGAALFDANGDNLLDIYLLQNGGPHGARNRLYLQSPNHTFRDASEGSGLDIPGYNMGVAVGDVNNDGRPDVLVTSYDGVQLFRNNGKGVFTNITAESGLNNPAWATSAAFVDYDRDGWLDLVVVNYLDYDPTWPCYAAGEQRDYCPPRRFQGRVTKLFRNLGPGAGREEVRFEDVTVSSGLNGVAGPGLGVLCADFNGNGWPDILVANDGEANRLWINQHDGTFREEAVRRGVAFNALGQAQGNMGVAWADVDGDGLFDLFITHLSEEGNTLWRQQPRGLFQDCTTRAGLTTSHWHGTGFGVVSADFDLDGAVDLALVNGRVFRGSTLANADLGEHWGYYAERNQLFVNEGTGRFRDRSREEPAFCGRGNVGRGLAWGDFDNDGQIDFLATTVAGRACLYRNVAPRKGHWLVVRALDPKLRRDAYGAEVRVTAGQQCWCRLINPGDSYLCSSDPRAHFGLGPAERVDSIAIVWPDGTTEDFPGRQADQFVELRKGEGRRSDANAKPSRRAAHD